MRIDWACKWIKSVPILPVAGCGYALIGRKPSAFLSADASIPRLIHYTEDVIFVLFLLSPLQILIEPLIYLPLPLVTPLRLFHPQSLVLWLISGRFLILLVYCCRTSSILTGVVGRLGGWWGIIDGPKDIIDLRLSKVSQLPWDVRVGLSCSVT